MGELFSPFPVCFSMSSSSESVSPNQNRSFPFTISAILSDEVGQKRSPPASCLNAPFSTPVSNSNSGKVPVYSMSSQASHRTSETPKRPRKSTSSYVSARTPKISHPEAGLKVPPSCQTYTNSEIMIITIFLHLNTLSLLYINYVDGIEACKHKLRNSNELASACA